MTQQLSIGLCEWDKSKSRQKALLLIDNSFGEGRYRITKRVEIAKIMPCHIDVQKKLAQDEANNISKLNGNVPIRIGLKRLNTGFTRWFESDVPTNA